MSTDFLRVTGNDEVLTGLPPVGHNVTMSSCSISLTRARMFIRPVFMFLEVVRLPPMRLICSALVFVNGVNLLRADDGNAYISAGFTYLVRAVSTLPRLLLIM